MKKILQLNGSPRKGEGYKIHEKLKVLLGTKGYSCEIVNLSEYNIHPCKGCYQCFLKGDDKCPFTDDIGELYSKIDSCDALIVSSPVYALGVSGTMKIFMDRIAFHAHRPTIYNKPMAIFANTAGMGTADVIKQLKWFELLGFNSVISKGFLKFPHKNDKSKVEKVKQKEIEKIAQKIDINIKAEKQTPSLIRVIQFNALKINPAIAPNVYLADYNYYKDKNFFVDTKIGVVKRLLGKLFFNIGVKSLKSKIDLKTP